MTFEDAKWFVVHTYSGYENKVASNIMKVVENRKMHDLILEVKVPVDHISEKIQEKDKKGNPKYDEVTGGPIIKEKIIDRKIYPGYVFIKVAVYYDEKTAGLKMTDETWYVIRNTRGVTGFVGPESKPVPLTESEAIKMGVEHKVVEVGYSVGDFVTVDGGPFDGFSGTVDSVDIENDTVRVIISMMGKETPIELGLDQVVIPE